MLGYSTADQQDYMYAWASQPGTVLVDKSPVSVGPCFSSWKLHRSSWEDSFRHKFDIFIIFCTCFFGQ